MVGVSSDQEYVTLERHQRELAELRKRIAELEDEDDESSASMGRDEKVLATLAVGDIVSRSDLVTLYRRETDISNEKTAVRRLKGLVESGYLENVAMGRWQVVEVPTDD